MTTSATSSADIYLAIKQFSDVYVHRDQLMPPVPPVQLIYISLSNNSATCMIIMTTSATSSADIYIAVKQLSDVYVHRDQLMPPVLLPPVQLIYISLSNNSAVHTLVYVFQLHGPAFWWYKVKIRNVTLQYG
jgi:hypothetical protein